MRRNPPDNVSPDRLFDQRWALAVMEQAMSQLQSELEAAGKGEQFARLKPFLSREGGKEEYSALGEQWGVTAGAVTVAIHRSASVARRDVLRGIVAQTVAGPDEWRRKSASGRPCLGGLVWWFPNAE
jgi:RNA polymerase sigma-70 factor (ECF subfamily)